MGPLLSTFSAAVQASLSVLLVLSYGAIAAKLGLVKTKHGKAISRMCVKIFLPALLLVNIGSELHSSSASRYLIILVWAIICHAISFILGITAHFVFGLPDWVTAAIMFNNTSAYPLLLIQSLDATGIMEGLTRDGETAKAGIERVKSYFLVFATVSNCLTFAIGPRLMDSEDDSDDKTPNGEENTIHNRAGRRPDEEEQSQPSERTSLLPPSRPLNRQHSDVSITFFLSKPKFTTTKRRPNYIPRLHWDDLGPGTKWWLLFLYDFLNAPLIGALLGAIIGLTPPLHRAFFAKQNDGGIFTAWLTESWRTMGELFIPLPLMVAGISLYTAVHEAKQGTAPPTRVSPATLIFVVFVRLIFWPVVSIGAIYAIAHKQGPHGILKNDAMLWFAMMLMPTGPPAMKLITMVQVSEAGPEEERRIAKILTISYVISPVSAFSVVAALRAVHAAAV